MKKLLNTLFVTSENAYLALEGETVTVWKEDAIALRVPLHTLQDILYFGYKGASPALLGACASKGIGLSFLTPNGKFLAAVSGEANGNVLLRKEQYRRSDDKEQSVRIARNFIAGKVYNGRWQLERALRDHPMRMDNEAVKRVSDSLHSMLPQIRACTDLDSLRGMEGTAAGQYFGVLNELILQNEDTFRFNERTRRPPLDPFNALLSFSYMLLASKCASALSSVGLDPYVGFMHRDRPGRRSLALDLMEELRPVIADRFVITLINNRIVSGDDFHTEENGAVMLLDSARKNVLSAWHSRGQETITHPFLEEKIEWGLVPYAQAMLLARFLRGDCDEYPPFLWK